MEINSELTTYIQYKKILALIERGGAVTGAIIRVQMPDSENYCTVDPWGRVEWFKGGSNES